MSAISRYVLLVLFVLVNLVAFALMGVDKQRARTHQWRVPEKTLFLAALLFGGTGGTIGMFFFHHKTKHWYFRIFFPLLAIVQLGIFGYLMQTYKVGIKKKLPNIYRHELLNNLFSHPYTKIEFVQQELNVNRQTASKYLQKLAEQDFIQSVKIGRNKYYLNLPLIKLFIDAGKQIGLSQDSIESVNQ